MEKRQEMKHAITIGILGGGQLAKMLANEAYRLGFNIAIIDKSKNTPAGDMTHNEFIKGWNDDLELKKFVKVSDIITLESEFIPPEILEQIEQIKPVYPSSKTLRLVQDKYIQKKCFSENNLSVAAFKDIHSLEDLYEFGNLNGFPFLAKTRTMGYDGYGNYTIKNKTECEIVWKKNEEKKALLVAEKFIDFEKELAVMVARNKSGETAVYPCVETIQQNHICHKVIAPAQINIDLSMQAQEIALKAVEIVDGVGIFGIEEFLTKDGKILINEIAPRPHNSGHYTIEGCYSSQFENTIRAILNLPLGSTEMIKKTACMINLLGTIDGVGVPNNISETLKISNIKLHLYNKKTSRIGRKMGHITAIADKIEDAIKCADKAADKFRW